MSYRLPELTPPHCGEGPVKVKKKRPNRRASSAPGRKSVGRDKPIGDAFLTEFIEQTETVDLLKTIEDPASKMTSITARSMSATPLSSSSSRPTHIRPKLPSIRGRPATSSTCGMRHVNRSNRKARPKSTTSTLMTEERSTLRALESDDDSDDNRTSITKATVDFDFGGVDIYADNGWDTDLEGEMPLEENRSDLFDVTGKAMYIESCRKLNVIPASYFLRHMSDDKLEMKHHGLGPQGAKPISIAMVSNTSVLTLDLSDNWLGVEGGNYVCDMMKENCYITELTLSDNRLGVPFAKKFVEVLANNSTLTHIILSGNRLCDNSASYLSEAIANTTKVEYLNLSKNMLSEGAGLQLGPAIAENTSLKHLDLSWNAIRKKGAIAVAQGVKQNLWMTQLDLSWNGVGLDGAKALGDALKANSTLEILDLANNRISTEGSVLLGKGLAVNEVLRELSMAQNPMQSAGAYALLAALAKNPNSGMNKLDFSSILVNPDFFVIYDKVKETMPDLKVTHGGDTGPKKPKARVHPMVKLKNYIEKHNMRLVDFFNKLDDDRSMSVTREEFTDGLAELGIKLTEEEVGTLLDELDKDGDGEVNYSELVMGHQDFSEREKKLPATVMNL